MDWYYEQLETAKPVTERRLAEMKEKKFSSGRPINVGDIIFFGFLQDGTRGHTITFHYDELKTLYKVVDDYSISYYPKLAYR